MSIRAGFLRWSFRATAVLAVCGLSLLPGRAENLIPDGSLMAHDDSGAQRLLLSPLDGSSVLNMASAGIKSVSCSAYAGLAPKAGGNALKFEGDAEGGGAKGDFAVTDAVPGELRYLGSWVYLTPDSNVSTVGFQVVDAEGEYLSATSQADWAGWQWIEKNLANGDFVQAFDQPSRNHKVDFPLKSVHVVWFTKKPGATFLGVDGLAALGRPAAAEGPFSIQVFGPAWIEAGQALAAQLQLNNFTDQTLELEVAYSIQSNAQLRDRPMPDRVLGTDRAQGQKSWIEMDGKRIEDNSLTDNDEGTGYSTEWSDPRYEEALQYVDLGVARQIVALKYHSGDANWVYKVDVFASQDGTHYQLVGGLEGFDLHEKWDDQSLPVKETFTARFLRLRYHNNGKKSNVLRLPTALYVYDGIANDEKEIPKVGETIEQQSVRIKVAARNFALLPVVSKASLQQGVSFFGAKAQGSAGTRICWANHYVMPVEIKLRPESHFGMNVSTPDNIPALKRLGVGWVRYENMKWMFYNPAPDDFRFDGSVAPWNVPFDDYVRRYTEAGMSFLPYVFQCPAWATSAPANVEKNQSNYPPKDYSAYGKALFELAARYGAAKHPAELLKASNPKSGQAQIGTFELWNEPNLNDPGWGFFVGPFEKYLELLRVGAEAVKRADPKAQVANGGFAGLSMKWIDRLHTYKYADGKTPLDFTDVLNVHFYSGRQEPELTTEDPNTDRDGTKTEHAMTYEESLQTIADWRDRLKPQMPIWLTETGNDVGGPIGRTERLQAAKIPRDLMIALANGVEKVFLYREVGSTPAMHAGAGVIRNDSTLRPSFFTLATLIRQLDGAREVRTPRIHTADPRVWLYRWKRPTDEVWTAWTPEGTAPLGLDLGRCKVTDAFGSVRETEVSQDFEVGVFPVYITQLAEVARR